MSVQGNVIHVDHPTFYCMRQCQESVKYLKKLNKPIYDVEIKGEEDIFRHFMKEVLTPVSPVQQEAA